MFEMVKPQEQQKTLFLPFPSLLPLSEGHRNFTWPPYSISNIHDEQGQHVVSPVLSFNFIV